MCVPRPEEKKFNPSMKRKIISECNFNLELIGRLPESIFKDYKIDNEHIVADCFEFDWEMMVKPKFRESTSIKI